MPITIVRNTIQVFTRNGSIELEKNPQAVSVDTGVTITTGYSDTGIQTEVLTQ